MRASAAALTGAPLNGVERALLARHRAALSELALVSAQETRLLDAGGAHSRGDVARYLCLLQDALQRKAALVSDLLRACDEYKATFGREVGLEDPLGPSPRHAATSPRALAAASPPHAGARPVVLSSSSPGLAFRA
jgi:hypothetical protein